MEHALLGYGIEFLIQTALLLGALWVMIKFRGLEYNLPGVIVSTGLAVVVEMVLNRFVPAYISTPVACLLLFFLIARVTSGEGADVVFAGVVAAAVMFGLNLYLVGLLMGNLRPATHSTRHIARVPPREPGKEPVKEPSKEPAKEPVVDRVVVGANTPDFSPRRTQHVAAVNPPAPPPKPAVTNTPKPSVAMAPPPAPRPPRRRALTWPESPNALTR